MNKLIRCLSHSVCCASLLCCLSILLAADSAFAQEAPKQSPEKQESRTPTGSAVPWLDRTFIQVYVGQMANMDLGDFLYAHNNLTKVMHDYMVTMGFGGEKALIGGFALGAEANASLHWGAERDDAPFTELSAGLYLRFYFPWSKTYLPSIALGDGVSYTSVIPEYEKRFGTGDLKERMESQWLNFLFVDVELLNVNNMALFYRVHHRCTIFGLVGSDLPGGINFHSVGLRFSF